MKKHLLTLLALLIAISSFSSPIDEATAKRYAENFWKENRIMGVRNGKVFKKKAEEARFVNIATRGGYSEFYIFNNEIGKGFVIVSADDCVTPILGYSYDNNFVVENMPDNVKGWMDGYAEQIRYAVNARLAATDEIREEWRCLQECKHLPIKSETAVNPLITTHWAQNPYYNDKCPFDYNHYQRTLTGCGATAMAQILKYWSYPEHGVGFNSYTPTSHPEYGTQYANFSETFYQWNSMPTELTSSNDAVSTLMYHCGVAVNMDYGLGNPYDGGSTSYLYGNYSIENAFKTYFDYKSTLTHIIKNGNYSNDQWISNLKEELNNGRPILYRGANSLNQGGHFFIFDGYKNSNEFHINWGWGSQYDGNYFFIDNLYNGGYDFSYYQMAIIGIEPNNTTYNFDLKYHNDLVISNDEYWFFDDISVYAEVLNDASGSFNGYIGAALYKEQDEGSYYYQDILDYWDRTSTPLPGGYYTHGDLDAAGGPPYIPGSYAICMVYSMDGINWNWIDNNGYDDAFFDIVYSSDIETDSDFTILTGNALYNGTDATVNVGVWNTGETTFYGNFRVSLADTDGNWVQNIGIYECNEGLDPGYYYTNGLDFSGTITAEPGLYLLELAYQEQGSTSWYYAGANNYPNPVFVYVLPAPVYSDQYEPNNTLNLAYSFSPSFSGNSASVSTTGSNLHNASDVDYYKVNLASGYDYTITPRLHDSYNSGNGNTYTVDGVFGYSTDGTTWSDFYDDVMQGNISVIDGGTVYFLVNPYFEGSIGTYLLSMSISRTQHAPNTYQISATASPSSGGSVSGAGTYAQGATCTLTATANANYSFVNWTENGTAVSSNVSYSFTVTGNRNLVAHFDYSPNQYTINATANPNNGGSISGTGVYDSGSTCTLTASANTGFTFVNWTENGSQVSTNASYSFTVTGNRNLVANFTQNSYIITVSTNPSNGGTATGSGTYNYGQNCTVSASPNNGFAFTNWTENGTQVSANATYSFTVNGNRNLVANFAQNVHTITATAGANGSISPSGAVSVANGGSQTFEMIPNSGYAVFEVYVDGNLVGSMTSFTFNNVEADHSIFVTFQHIDGIGENMNNEIVIYPNPTNGILNVQCSEIDEIRVYNVYGVLVAKTKTNGKELIQIDLSNVSAGVYLMQAIRNDESVSKVFVKE